MENEYHHVIVDLISGSWYELTLPDFHIYNPSFSPDGKELLFTGDLSQTDNIYRLNLNNGSLFNVTESYPQYTRIDGTIFSPDGKKICYRWNEKICTINADGTNFSELFQTGQYIQIEDFQFTPDSRQVILHMIEFSPNLSEEKLVSIDCDGSNSRTILSFHESFGDCTNCQMFRISEDGQRIYFKVTGLFPQRYANDLYSANMKGEDIRHIIQFQDYVHNFDISPNGTQIFFTGVRQQYQIIRIDLMENLVTQMTDSEFGNWGVNLIPMPRSEYNPF
jgi:Tol biopolymer transport system component